MIGGAATRALGRGQHRFLVGSWSLCHASGAKFLHVWGRRSSLAMAQEPLPRFSKDEDTRRAEDAVQRMLRGVVAKKPGVRARSPKYICELTVDH